jgi:hypothetical protein
VVQPRDGERVLRDLPFGPGTDLRPLVHGYRHGVYLLCHGQGRGRRLEARGARRLHASPTGVFWRGDNARRSAVGALNGGNTIQFV